MPVTSNQDGPHPDLEALWDRRQGSHWQAPMHEQTLRALEVIEPDLQQAEQIILDSGCGTGASTANLAGRHTDALVLGIDKSAHRLARAPELPGNAMVLRADVVTAWRYLREQGLAVRKNYLLYPNPWPKAAHLARRWHGHPVFPELLGLSSEIELRTNWQTYAKEFVLAAELLGYDMNGPAQIEPTEPLTPFERKYANSGQTLYRVRLTGFVPDL